MGGIVRSEKGVLVEIGGIADHVHLLVGLKADTAVAVFLREVKSGSSKWLNQQKVLAEHFEWQIGYAAFSVSESQVARVRRYIQNQEDHHTRVSFRDELITLLKKHRIDYDERYLLG